MIQKRLSAPLKSDLCKFEKSVKIMDHLIFVKFILKIKLDIIYKINYSNKPTMTYSEDDRMRALALVDASLINNSSLRQSIIYSIQRMNEALVVEPFFDGTTKEMF